MKTQSLSFSIRGMGLRVGLQEIFARNLLRLFYAMERLFGPGIVPWMAAIFIFRDIVKRRKDYAPFVRLRKTLPDGFWKGIGPLRHALKMTRDWHETIATALLYHRLGSPEWQKRFEIVGTPLHVLPEWGSRPVVLAFLHTGPYGLFTYWLRSQKIAASYLAEGLPPALMNKLYQKMEEAGDARYDLKSIPLRISTTELREAIRFLQPGHVLGMALDGAKVVPEFVGYQAGGFPIQAKDGACRIAATTNAVVIPVSISRIGGCRFEIRFGKAVPDELIQKKDFFAATQYLISELWPNIEKNPGDMNWTTLDAFSSVPKTKRRGWP
jgi:lauroyl/myristoyl acyltransferase